MWDIGWVGWGRGGTTEKGTRTPRSSEWMFDRWSWSGALGGGGRGAHACSHAHTRREARMQKMATALKPPTKYKLRL